MDRTQTLFQGSNSANFPRYLTYGSSHINTEVQFYVLAFEMFRCFAFQGRNAGH